MEIGDRSLEGTFTIKAVKNVLGTRQQIQGLQPPPKTIIEFSTYVGSSAIAWGAILRDLHGKNVHDCNVCTFELSPLSAQVARDLIRLAGLEDLARVLSLKSSIFFTESLVIADNTDIPGAPDYLVYVKAGGRGGKGTVRYDSQSLQAVAEEGHPENIVEASTVVDIDP
ncbi:transport protein particle subunit trs23 [Aspergillus udagawae]|uniref:Transport protein particle subunit trs23 n=1 Tax=Aspergillus udagawae TaxID=91492 RepID=A0A8H3P3P4_9EURO|nr:transport protein particle subunit trs23 [Aspergillus udagawae]